MGKKYDYKIGEIYGCVKYIKSKKDKNNRTLAVVKCIYCNKEKTIRIHCLYDDKYNSCVCRIKKHGMNKTKIYSIYHNMKDRCYNNNCHAWKDYGGRGISICEEWLSDFINFYNWASNNGYKEGLSIDRIDVNGNYEPNNCRWITKSCNTALSNNHNVRRKAKKGTYYGISPGGEYYEFDNASEFARKHNLHDGCVRAVANRIKKSYKKWQFGFTNERIDQQTKPQSTIEM